MKKSIKHHHVLLATTYILLSSCKSQASHTKKSLDLSLPFHLQSWNACIFLILRRWVPFKSFPLIQKENQAISIAMSRSQLAAFSLSGPKSHTCEQCQKLVIDMSGKRYTDLPLCCCREPGTNHLVHTTNC